VKIIDNLRNSKGAATMTNQRKKTKSIFEKTPFLSKFVSFNFLN
jgi:hypothetical protein